MEKLLAIVALGQSFYGRWLFRRLLIGIVMVVALAIIIAIMVSAMLITSLYVAYSALLSYAIEPHMAMVIVGFLALTITLALVTLTLRYLQRLSIMPRATSPLSSLLDSFTNGLMTEKR